MTGHPDGKTQVEVVLNEALVREAREVLGDVSAPVEDALRRLVEREKLRRDPDFQARLEARRKGSGSRFLPFLACEGSSNLVHGERGAGVRSEWIQSLNTRHVGHATVVDPLVTPPRRPSAVES